MRTVTDFGKYTRKAGNEAEVVSGEAFTDEDSGKPCVKYSYEYKVIESIDDLPEADIIKLANRMLKQDGNNPSRESARRANGDSKIVALTPEQKAQDKADRAVQRAIKAEATRRGLSLDEVLAKLAELG